MRVTGIGQCSWDSLALVDVYPVADTKKEIIELQEQGGGPVATALVTLCRLGMSCSFHGVTGDDDAGVKIRQGLLEEGIEVRGLIRRKNASSQTAFIAIEQNTASRTIFWKRPSGTPLQPGELRDDLLEGSRFLLLDGLMKEVSLYAAKKARMLGIPVMLDAGSARPGLLEVAAESDYLVASREFARGFGWDLEPAALRKEKERLGVKVITITCGREGNVTVSDDLSLILPAFNVDALDTTGAGDVFHGGYIYGLLQGWDLKRTILFASAVSAMKCRRIGGRAGIPRLSEALQFLEENGWSSQQ